MDGRTVVLGVSGSAVNVPFWRQPAAGQQAKGIRGERPRGVCAFIKCASVVPPFLAIGHRSSNLQHNANCIVVELLYNWCNVAGASDGRSTDYGCRTLDTGLRTPDYGLWTPGIRCPLQWRLCSCQ